MQINSVLLAAAGAQRVFQILDEKPEFDEGYVKLVMLVLMKMEI